MTQQVTYIFAFKIKREVFSFALDNRLFKLIINMMPDFWTFVIKNVNELKNRI